MHVHFFLGGETLTFGRFLEGPSMLQKDSRGEKKLSEKDQLGVLKLLKRQKRLRVDYMGAF